MLIEECFKYHQST